MTADIVAKCLTKWGVRYTRSLHGFDVGNLRLQRGGGIATHGGSWYVHEIRGPKVRSWPASSQRALRKLVCDFFPRWYVRQQRETFGNATIEVVRAPRKIRYDGTQVRS